MSRQRRLSRHFLIVPILGVALPLSMRVQQFDAVLEAEAVWVAQPYEVGPKQSIVGKFGLRFLELDPTIAELLEQIMRAKVQPERVNLTIRPIAKRGLE